MVRLQETQEPLDPRGKIRLPPIFYQPGVRQHQKEARVLGSRGILRMSSSRPVAWVKSPGRPWVSRASSFNCTICEGDRQPRGSVIRTSWSSTKVVVVSSVTSSWETPSWAQRNEEFPACNGGKGTKAILIPGPAACGGSSCWVWARTSRRFNLCFAMETYFLMTVRGITGLLLQRFLDSTNMVEAPFS